MVDVRPLPAAQAPEVVVPRTLAFLADLPRNAAGRFQVRRAPCLGRASTARWSRLALDVVDARPHGFADLTLAAVAARAGVAVPSLYKHVAGLPALRREVARSASSSSRRARRPRGALGRRPGPRHGPGHPRPRPALPRPLPGGPGRPGCATPRRTTSARRAPGRSDELSDAVAALGVPDDRRIDAVRAFRAAVHGFVVLELDGGFGMPDDVDRASTSSSPGLVGGLERLSVS